MKALKRLGSTIAGLAQFGVHSASASSAVRFLRPRSQPGRPTGPRALRPSGTVHAHPALFVGNYSYPLLNREGQPGPENPSPLRRILISTRMRILPRASRLGRRAA